MVALKRVSEKEEDGVIRKVGNKWRILRKNRKDYWDAEYDTKADAEAALRAYWANKRESVSRGDAKLEYFAHDLDSILIKEFGEDSLDLSVLDIGEIQIALKNQHYMLYKLKVLHQGNLVLAGSSVNDGRMRTICMISPFNFTSDQAKLVADSIIEDMRKRKDIKIS